MLRQIYHESDLLIAECIREGALSGLEPAELASLASCFVFEARGGSEEREIHFPSPRLKNAYRAIEKVSTRLARREGNHGLATHRVVDPGLMGHIAEWAIGDDLGDVLGFDDVSGGDFVRSSKQILDLLRQLAEIMPGPKDREAARAAIPLIDRGLVARSQVPFEAPDAD
jgi:ATP-dependent RNA helicase HelY